MVFREFKVRKERCKIRPTRKKLRMNHQPVKRANLLDIGIDLLSQLLEVRCCQGTHGRNNQNTFVLQQFTLDHIRHSRAV